MLTVGSLFSGIGGLERGLEQAGLGPVLWQVEQDAWCHKVLAKHWPDAERFDDVRKVGEQLKPVSVIAGGFPCQDISNAGKRAGIEGERSGLWSEFARIVRVVGPRFVVVENVSALLGRGMGVVLGDLAALGYDAIWDCVPAKAIGAPHQRDRLYLVAWRVSDAERNRVRHEPERGNGPAQEADCGDAFSVSLGEAVAGSDGRRVEGSWSEFKTAGPLQCGQKWPPPPDDLHAWRRVQADAQPSVCRLADGLPDELLRDRAQKLKALGNAVVPQVAEVIGRVVLRLTRLQERANAQNAD